MFQSFRYAALALALASAAIACNRPASHAAETRETAVIGAEARPSRAYINKTNVPSSGLALEGYCPVAYFVANKPIKGKPEFSSEHEGVTYWFVNAEAKAAFDAAPAQYIPAYGGWCALGMAIEDKFPIDPRSFKIVDGRLLLFLENDAVDALELWNKGNEAELLAKADAYWGKVRK